MSSQIYFQTGFTLFVVVLLAPLAFLGSLLYPSLLEIGLDELEVSQDVGKVENYFLNKLNSSISKLEDLRSRKLAEVKVDSKLEGKYRNLIDFEAYP